MSKTAFLKDKTDEQCRQLAAHYYIRARKSEKDLALANAEVSRLRANLQAFRGMAYDLIESIEDE